MSASASWAKQHGLGRACCGAGDARKWGHPLEWVKDAIWSWHAMQTQAYIIDATTRTSPMCTLRGISQI